jgi:pimeloyl-ACP methyl ester carboxylesterase
MGYSSGGHAVFAARDWAESYAPELPIKGIMGFGPTTNVETLMREDPIFSPYIVSAYRAFYGEEIIEPGDVFMPHWVDQFETDTLTKCVDDMFAYYTRSARDLYAPEFREALYGGGLSQAYPRFAEALDANNAGLRGGSSIPVLILQGTGDTVVTPDTQRAFKEQLCAKGGRVTYLEYTAIAHFDIRWTSYGDALSWMQHVMQGDVPGTDCEVLGDDGQG